VPIISISERTARAVTERPQWDTSLGYRGGTSPVRVSRSRRRATSVSPSGDSRSVGTYCPAVLEAAITRRAIPEP
jgi:hypothetical protein